MLESVCASEFCFIDMLFRVFALSCQCGIQVYAKRCILEENSLGLARAEIRCTGILCANCNDCGMLSLS